MPFLASEECFWAPTASMTSEVKNNYAYKFIEVNFCVGYGFIAKSSVSTLNIRHILMR